VNRRTVDHGPTAAPAAYPSVVDGALDRVRDGLVEGISSVVGAQVAGDMVEVTLPLLRRARTCPGSVGRPDAPFAWKPVFARRSLGLAAVRACADGRFRGPAEAVGPLASASVDEWRRTGRRTFHWEPWFEGLGDGARAVVLAEATTWAGPLWAAADWAALGGRAVLGGPDDLWTCPGPRTVRLKGRWEARVAPSRPTGGAEGPPAAGPVLVSVSGGIPDGGWADELAFLALVAALRSTDQPVPARVVGLWPEAGERRTVEVDEASLTDAAERVVAVVASVVDARAPGSVAA